MSKRGTMFVAIVESQQRQPALWEPHAYQRAAASARLGDYVEVRNLRRLSDRLPSPFRPIEYSDISGGDHLTFTLDAKPQGESAVRAVVVEQALLMGTMRAYLGNIIVTPRAAWLGRSSPLGFAVKSEFVQLVPRDGLVYFWWAYVRSVSFLTKLPAGGGGTRPRLQPEVLAATGVRVVELERRAAINRQLELCAAREWREWLRRRAVIEAARLTD
ncbi:MAG TPA: hypothetical protein VKA60_22525 [Blastocatellia bacterium]|nr:hypothetical protein [Blastocatellia bacterium]